MKNLFFGLALALGLILTAPVADVAADSDSWSGGIVSAPELDATVAGSAMVLLLGGVAYLASRRRKDD
ncbi:MAG: hypothetical protein JSV06_09395 [Myxococcales bacterium]|nr:MAG: hypothetical protein JSV06_09395 [Myxococcales bacterium]